MTIQRNNYIRHRASVNAADGADPATTDDSIFVDCGGAWYAKVFVQGLTGVQAITVRPVFLVKPRTSAGDDSAVANYIQLGEPITLSLALGNIFTVYDVFGDLMYIKVDAITAGATVNIYAAKGDVNVVTV
jgi:hypothetical protein